MFKAKKAVIFILPVFLFCLSFRPVFAADNVFNVRWARPAYGSTSGYIDILREINGRVGILTYWWSLDGPHSYSTQSPTLIKSGSVKITLSDNSINFQCIGGANAHIFYFQSWEPYSPNGYLITTIDSYTNNFDGNVLGCHIYGDCYQFVKNYNRADVNFTVIHDDTASEVTQLLILEALQSSGEKEKSEAQSGSQSAQSDAQNALPDNSGSLLDGVGGFISGMSYNGTDCKWTFPAISLPAISGVMDTVQLSTAKDIAFSDFLNVIPDGILTIMRAICSVAVIVFGFKEFYSTIEYVLTLRGGSDTV